MIFDVNVNIYRVFKYINPFVIYNIKLILYNFWIDNPTILFILRGLIIACYVEMLTFFNSISVCL